MMDWIFLSEILRKRFNFNLTVLFSRLTDTSLIALCDLNDFLIPCAQNEQTIPLTYIIILGLVIFLLSDYLRFLIDD